MRIDVFGPNRRPEFEGKCICLNDRPMAPVPDADLRDARISALLKQKPEVIRLGNKLIVWTPNRDAWKFRDACVAVQLADGRGVNANLAKQVWSAPGWKHTQGETWGEDGIAGPIALRFPH